MIQYSNKLEKVLFPLIIFIAFTTIMLTGGRNINDNTDVTVAMSENIVIEEVTLEDIYEIEMVPISEQYPSYFNEYNQNIKSISRALVRNEDYNEKDEINDKEENDIIEIESESNKESYETTCTTMIDIEDSFVVYSIANTTIYDSLNMHTNPLPIYMGQKLTVIGIVTEPGGYYLVIDDDNNSGYIRGSSVVEYEFDTSTRLSAARGSIIGPSGRETYYNLPMDGIISMMRNMGFSEEEYPYWIREDGCKMLGDYIMVAANLSVRPRGSLVECSLGMAIVCDTGGFAANNPYQLDIATNW